MHVTCTLMMSLHSFFQTPRPWKPTDFLIPSFKVGQGVSPTLTALYSHTFDGVGTTRTGSKFLAQALTVSMQAAYPSGVWDREFGSMQLPGSFGQMNLKSAAVQDGARANISPRDLQHFADHRHFGTTLIYLSGTVSEKAKVSQALMRPLHLMLPAGQMHSMLDVAVELKALEQSMRAQSMGVMKPVLGLSGKLMQLML